MDVERAADVVLVVLRHVEVLDVLVLEQDLPHAREVADHVADRREHHAVEAVEPAGEPQLDRRARDAADVALVVGVALDHLELVAAAEDADRQHPGRVDELARDVDRHVADRLASRHGGLPRLDRAEVEVLEQRLAALDDLDHCRDRWPSAVLPLAVCAWRGTRRGLRWRRACASVGRGRAARPRRAGGARRRSRGRRAPRRRRRRARRRSCPAGAARSTPGPRARGRRRRVCTRPIACASAPLIERPENSRSSAAGWLTRYGSSTEAAGANTPSSISGWPSCASGAAKIGAARERDLEPAAEALAAHRDQDRHRELDHLQDQRRAATRASPRSSPAGAPRRSRRS